MEVAVDANVLIEQTRRQDALIHSLERDSCRILSNVQLVVINGRCNRSYSDTRLIFSIEVLYELLSCCTRGNVLDAECQRFCGNR